MNSTTSFLFISAIVALTFAKPSAKNAIVIGDILYYSDSTKNRSRAEAVAYCQAQGGELAKVWNQNLYNQLRLSIRQIGPYWINGVDRPDIYKYEMEHTCSFRGEHWNFWGMQAAYMDFPTTSCLTLVKGPSATTSRLTAADCNEYQFVLCQYPLEGCVESAPPPPSAARTTIETTTT